MIRAIIVDDEALARRELRRLLETMEGVSVVGEAKDVATARGLADRTRPDVVFLDIRLRQGSGFELLPDLDDNTAVVFVTAYEQYAVLAFEENALDYLLKPVDPARLAQSVERVEALLGGQRSASGAGEAAPYTAERWIFVQEGDGARFVRLDTISRIDSERGGSVIRTPDGAVIRTARSLEQWIRRLPAGDFRRVHRATIVNLAHVERVEPWAHYTYRLHLRGGAEPVIMSRRYAVRLRETL
jgi:two-component system, LytTR family, response regulator